MKKLLIIIIAIAIIAGVQFWKKSGQVETIDTTPAPTTKNFQPDPSTATFIFDDQSVTLSKGEAETTDEAMGFTTETKLLDEKAYGDLNNDGKEDSVVFLAQSGGGSGVFIYTAAYVSGPVSYKGTSAIFLGDRIAPQSVSISNGVATVRYLDRKADEAFAAEPTVSTSKQFIYKNGEFQER